MKVFKEFPDVLSNSSVRSYLNKETIRAILYAPEEVKAEIKERLANGEDRTAAEIKRLKLANDSLKLTSTCRETLMQTMQLTPAEAMHPAWLYSTVKQFSEKHPAFSVGSLRSLIFSASSNGLNESGAIVRVGRKILLNETKFFGWIEAQSGLKGA